MESQKEMGQTVGYILQTEISPPPRVQEGKVIDMDDTGVISDMTHITAKTSHYGKSDSSNSLSRDLTPSIEYTLSPDYKIFKPTN